MAIETTGTRMMIYSHDTYGLGHYRRNLLISNYMLKRNPSLSILLVTGSPIAGRFTVKGNFDYIKLPSVIKIAPEEYSSRFLHLPFQDIKKIREKILLQCVQNYRPHILLVDHSPIGMKGEMIPTLQFLKNHSNTCKVCLGLRDILDEPEKVKKVWKQEQIYQQIDSLYDQIFVYGLRELFDVTAQYDFTPTMSKKTQFCGYIYGGLPKRHPDIVKEQLHCSNKPLILVTVGGGDDGFPIAKTYLEMIQQFKDQIQFFTYLVTGPLMNDKYRKELQRLKISHLVTTAEFERDLIGTMVAADLVISMGGYNSICEILQFAQRAVIIPRTYPRKEQYLRAQILQDQKLLSLLLPNELTRDKLFNLIQSGLKFGTQTQIRKRRVLLQLNGLEKLSESILDEVSEPSALVT